MTAWNVHFVATRGTRRVRVACWIGSLVAIGLLGATALYAMSAARLDCIRSGQPIIGHEIGGRPVCLAARALAPRETRGSFDGRWRKRDRFRD
jgi:hypothetical protein